MLVSIEGTVAFYVGCIAFGFSKHFNGYSQTEKQMNYNGKYTVKSTTRTKIIGLTKEIRIDRNLYNLNRNEPTFFPLRHIFHTTPRCFNSSF